MQLADGGFVCSNAEVDEAAVERPLNLRAEVMFGIYSVALGAMDFQIRKFFSQHTRPVEFQESAVFNKGDMRMLFDGVCESGFGQRYERGFDGVEVIELKQEDLDALVNRWRETIVALCLAHDKDAVDAAEFGMDDLLTPLITIPGSQLKTFWSSLRKALENDQRTPFFVWKFFRVWEGGILAHAEEVGPVELKRELAGRIAAMVEQSVKPDIMEAITGALQWRSAETLEKVEGTIKRGGRARLKGRESCLFLEIMEPADPCECGDKHGVEETVAARVML